MKGYLRALIEEQINRGFYLKTLIPHPLKYSELSSLADRCSRMIDDNIEQLRYLLRQLDQRRDSDDVRDIYRGLRTCARFIELIEYFGISALFHESDEIGYLNKLVWKVHQEIGLPITPPSVACISTNYYYFYPVTNVIFVPLGETDFLLHLPDAFHEIGHEVLFNRQNDLRLDRVNQQYTSAIGGITRYYQQLLIGKMREFGPGRTIQTIMSLHSLWKDFWLEEFFSDLFACYTLGPAYAWSHLHLTTKKTEDAFSISQRHPSDDSRMKMLLIGLRKLGFEKEASSISSKWNSMPFIAGIEPIEDYSYAYPTSLMDEVAVLFLASLRESNFVLVSPEKLKSVESNNVVYVLNQAWGVFWSDSDHFREWERETIINLKRSL